MRTDQDAPDDGVRISARSKWHESGFADGICRWIGHAPSPKILGAFSERNTERLLPCLRDTLRSAEGFFAAVIITAEYVFAGVDRVRSYPLFYAPRSGIAPLLSDSAVAIKSELGAVTADPVNRLEFELSGYVTGPETLFGEIRQLRAGEFLLAGRTNGDLTFCRYYEFLPRSWQNESPDKLLQELDERTDAIFARLITRAYNRRIVIPLSGGLDSRLVVCKLRQHGFNDVVTFSYGSPRNDEAKYARLVAGKLGYQWHFVPTRMSDARKRFYTTDRANYWKMAHNYSVIPSMAEWQAFSDLHERGFFRDSDIIVNGQSGDFITGGHLLARSAYRDCSASELYAAVFAKHFTLWSKTLGTVDSDALRRKFFSIAGLNETVTAMEYRELCARHELWEWQERQSKYVVNGQRTYDYFGLEWDLPLWDKELTDFWQDIPAEIKAGQALYKTYLEQRDFFGLFRSFKPQIWRWPGVTKLVPVIAQPIKWLLGRQASEQFYKFFAYWGHYRSQYAPFPFKEFVRCYKVIRNPMSLYVRQWLLENMAIK